MRRDDGAYVYRDIAGHPSVEANYLARPLLIGLLKRIVAARKIEVPLDVGGTR